jgi:AcrR family transcriptional regulator
MPRLERRKRRTREAIIKAAVALFTQKGVYATRVEDITERADLGKGAFYNYFESKDALVAELVNRGVRLLEEQYLSKVSTLASTAERVSEIAHAHSRFFEEHPEYVVLFHQARGLLIFKTNGVRELRETFADYLECIAARYLPRVEWERLTQETRADIAAAVAGAIAGYRSFRTSAGLATNVETLTAVITRGVPEAIRLRQAVETEA